MSSSNTNLYLQVARLLHECIILKYFGHLCQLSTLSSLARYLGNDYSLNETHQLNTIALIEGTIVLNHNECVHLDIHSMFWTQNEN